MLRRCSPHGRLALAWQAGDTILQAVRRVQLESNQAELLKALAPQLPLKLIAEAWTQATAMEKSSAKATSLACLSLRMPEEVRAGAVREAFQAVKEAREPLLLEQLVPVLPHDLRPEAAAEIRAAVARVREIVVKCAGDERGRQLQRLVSLWQSLGFAGLEDGRRFWSETLRAVSRHPRNQMLFELGALAPLAAYVAVNADGQSGRPGRTSEEICSEIFDSIFQVITLWP